MNTKEKIHKAYIGNITYSDKYYEEDAIGILASTPYKFSKRFEILKRNFPRAEFLRVETKEFIDIYIVKLNELHIEYGILSCIKETIKERNQNKCSDKEALDFIEQKIKEMI